MPKQMYKHSSWDILLSMSVPQHNGRLDVVFQGADLIIIKAQVKNIEDPLGRGKRRLDEKQLFHCTLLAWNSGLAGLPTKNFVILLKLYTVYGRNIKGQLYQKTLNGVAVIEAWKTPQSFHFVKMTAEG